MPEKEIPPVTPDRPESSTSQDISEIEKLAREHASQLFVISQAITNNAELGRQAVVKTFAAALIHREQSGALPKAEWLYSQTVRVSRQLVRRSPTSPLGQSAEGAVDTVIWPLLDAFDWRERLLCALHFALEWPEPACAGLLNVSQNAVQAQLHIFQARFKKALAGRSQVETDRKDASLLAIDSIRRRYPAPDWSDGEIANLLEDIQRELSSFRNAPRRKIPLRKLLIGGISGLAIALCLAGGLYASLKVIPSRPTATIGPTPFGTPLSSLNKPPIVVPLSWISSPETIRRRLQESATLWSTLYMDVQMNRYGPASYIGAPRVYQLQSWIDQPDESVQLSGLLSKGASELYLQTNGRSYELNTSLNISSNQEVFPSPETLIENVDLRQMIYPSLSRWAAQNGTFRVYDTGRILDRNALVVDWYNAYGQRESRLWLDTITGVVLRRQEYGGPDFSLLLSDDIATEITFDQDDPPAWLASAMQELGASIPQAEPDTPQLIHPTPTLAVPHDRRPSLSLDPAPAGFDPGFSRLKFQFPYNLENTNVFTGTAQVPIQLFADNYWIAETKFGLPWMLRCDRSPDGERLAFNTGMDGASPADDSLRWLDLREPQEIYAPLPSLHTDAFAFSPDSSRIALFGRGDTPDQNGLYLVELALGESRKVLPLIEANSLVWSPDGENLALIGVFDPESGQEAALIHMRTGQISFRAPYTPDAASIPEDWPMSNWGVSFPQSMGGMDDCAAPPKG